MARALSSKSGCGIRVAASASNSTRKAVTELKQQLAGAGDFQHLITFFGTEHAPESLIAALAEAFPGVPVSGCTTAGEIGPAGMMQGGVLLIAFPKDGFRVRGELITEIGIGVEHATAAARRLKAQVASGPDRLSRSNAFALLLVDGLSNVEETVVAAIHWGLDDIPLIGGSAGDGLSFRRTAVIHDGRIASRAAVLLMIESDYPFEVFKTQNFEPTPIKLVVTSADAEKRIVYELNAEPAAREYASAIGLQPDELGPFSFASYPLVVKVGGDYYCRSIRNMNPDGSLSFFCAIDEGLVFTVARPHDMLQSTAAMLEQLDAKLGGIDLVIGFDCILRRLDAETRQIRREMDALYRKYSVAGFQTYGEQFNAMHLNQTLTGIAFGQRREA